MAGIGGNTRGMKYSFENKNPYYYTEEFNLDPDQMLIEDKVVKVWADNDGGLWFYDEGRTVHIK